MGFLELGAHLGAELLGWQDVALLVERGTLQPSTALGQRGCTRPGTSLFAMHRKGATRGDMSSGLKTTHHEKTHWYGVRSPHRLFKSLLNEQTPQEWGRQMSVQT